MAGKMKLNELKVQSFTTSKKDDLKGGKVGLHRLTEGKNCVSPLCMTVSDPCACDPYKD